MNFSDALYEMKCGKKLTNIHWNGKGMYVKMQFPDEHSKMTHPYIYMHFSADHPIDANMNVPWFPSQLDLFSQGWEVVSDAV